MLKRYFETRRARRNQKDYINGYDWATGAILRGELTRDHLEKLAFSGCNEADPFDKGAQAALRRLEELGVLPTRIEEPAFRAP